MKEIGVSGAGFIRLRGTLPQCFPERASLMSAGQNLSSANPVSANDLALDDNHILRLFICIGVCYIENHLLELSLEILSIYEG